MTPEELAWAAGLFEGEGTVSHQRGRPLLALAMTDQDVVERFFAVVGVGRVRPASRAASLPHHKPQWRWACSRVEDVRAVLDQFHPWLGTRRRARAAELFAAYDKDLAKRMAERPCLNCGTIIKPQSPKGTEPSFCTKRCRDRWFYHRRPAITAGQLTLKETA